VLHAHDATGREITRTLHARLAGAQGFEIFDHVLATSLQIEHGRCCGVRGPRHRSPPVSISAPAVLLATGGAGRVFQETTNPAIATGDGLAMAWRAGARLGDLEFVQFHPTVLHVPGRPRFLVSEAVRGEGARLLNADGETFMSRYDPRGDLAPRDVVATAMVRESTRTGRSVYLSLQHLDAAWVRARFPGIAAACREAGLDLATDLLPVSPARTTCAGEWTPISPGARRCQACSPPARSRARACTAPIGSPATRCSRGSSSVRGRRRPCRARSGAAIFGRPARSDRCRRDRRR
jgi:L-aspartate oxidase